MLKTLLCIERAPKTERWKKKGKNIFPFIWRARRGLPFHLAFCALHFNMNTLGAFLVFGFCSSWNQSFPILMWELSQQPLTCTKGGFQRRFFSGAGVKWKEPVGRFFSSSRTPAGFSRNLATRFFSCHPTWKRIITSFIYCCFFSESKQGKSKPSGLIWT